MLPEAPQIKLATAPSEPHFGDTRSRKAGSAPLAPARCFHCGEDVPAGENFSVLINELQQPMCCPGCRAVASLIVDGGMARFYEQRSAFNEKPQVNDPARSAEFLIYDEPELAATFSEQTAQGRRRARLLLGGMTCAACTWLIENSLAKLPAVQSANVNLSQSRLDVEFDAEQLPVSALFGELSAMGYRVRPFHSSTQQQQQRAESRADLRRLAVAGVGMMQVGMFAIALHAGDMQGIDAAYQALLRWVSLLVAGFVVLFSARPFFASAWRHLQQGALVMDLPVALAISLAFAASAYATLSNSGQVYFDSVVMFTFFLLLARYTEQRARHRDSSALLDAESSLPDAAVVMRDGAWQAVPRQQVDVDSVVLVRAGDTLPIDGVVCLGESAVREDAFNGEPAPRAVGQGDAVFAGTVNTEAALEVRCTASYLQTRLAALQRSVDAAAGDKPELAKLADRIASVFIGLVLLATLLTAGAWYLHSRADAFWVALSVLVISCPCALALATPAALANAAAALRRRGILVRTENALDTLSRATHLVFDKTGTLTNGDLTIRKVLPLAELSSTEILGLVASMQRYSNHPLARAFTGIEAAAGVTAVRYVVGAGLAAEWAGGELRTGSVDFCRAIAPDLPAAPNDALYWIGLCRGGEALALVGLEDSLRAEAPAVIAAARQRGLELALLTGDASQRGVRLADTLGIDNAVCGMNPDQKRAYVKGLQDEGAVVVMVGDGLNDAPVLRGADASFAVAGATDLARAQADFVIAEGSLQGISTAFKHSARCRRIILQNFTWALAYNALGIPLAALGQVPPWAAAIGMSLSSLLVVANSLRLAR